MGTMIDSLREDLSSWTRAAIRADLGPCALAALERDVAVPAAVAAESGTRIALLTRLFWLGEALDDAELALALPRTMATASAAAQRFFLPSDGGWRSPWQVVPIDIPPHLARVEGAPLTKGGHADLDTVWIASSHGTLQGARHGEHFVMGVGGATRTLAALAAYEPGQRVLDLGTGSGVHAVFAALSGAQVVATDISEVALDMARFNASLNGVAPSIDFRLGSLFEPVTGEGGPERFDVIVSNPPFVITPAAARARVGELDYRDGGLEGDQLSAQVVGGLSSHLTPGGRAWMLTNWEISSDEVDPFAPVRTWAGPDLDIHLVMREKLPVTSYIEMWLRDGGLTPAHPDYADSYCAWLADFDTRHVTHIGLGYLAAGRGDGVVIGQELRGLAPANVHDYMERIWAGRTQTDLTGLAPVATDVVEHRFYHPGEEEPWIIKFTQTNGFGEEVMADTALAGFVSVADGELTTAQIVNALAQLLSEEAGNLMEKLEPQIQHMKRLGMLTFEEPVRA